MRAWLPGILIALGAIVFLVWGSLAETDTPPRIDPRESTALASGIVASITDGDTIRLADNRRIRLVQIDAPERSSGECYAERASSTLTQLLPIGTDVDLRLDPKLDARDEGGRFLAYVLRGKTNVNLRLVEVGAAAPYFFRRERGRYADQLMRAARSAKAAGYGLWRACPATQLNPYRAVDARK